LQACPFFFVFVRRRTIICYSEGVAVQIDSLIVDGGKLRDLRRRRLLSRRELADTAGVSPSTVSLLERQGGPCQLRTVRKIAEALEVDAMEFAEWERGE
jgi:predicted transcriptional regulator